MAVRDIARKNVVTGGPDESVADLVRKLHRNEVNAAIIIEDGKPQGLVGHRDISKALLDPEFDAETVPVGEFLTGDVVTVDADVGLYDLLDLLSDRGLRRVPVVEDEELLGIISLSDIVVLLGMELQHVANAIRSSSPAYERSGPAFYDRE